MNTKNPAHSLFKHKDALMASFIGFMAIYFLTKHGGIGISPDSIAYESVARNIHQGKGMVTFIERPLVDFPVFYPVFLSAVFFITGLDVLVFAPVLNGILFAIVIFLSGYIMEHFVHPSRVYKCILLGCIVLSPTLLEVYSMLWSETLFILWSLLFFIAIKNYFHKHSTFSLLLMGIVAALAFDTRYAGITFTATGCLLLLFDNAMNWVKKLAHLLTFGAISIFLVLINLMRNAVATGQLTGPRQRGITPLSKNIEYYGSVISDWFAFFSNHYSFALLIGIAVMVIFILAFVIRTANQANYNSYENIATAFFIVYASFIVVSSTLSRYETINSRLLSPALIPFLWGMTYKLPAWISSLTPPFLRRIAAIILLIITVAFYTLRLKEDKTNFDNINESGVAGYAEDIWKESPLVQYLKKDTVLFKPDNIIYSNANHAVYFFTNRSVDALPERVHHEEVKEFYTENNFYLIWFNNDFNPDLLNLQEIGKQKTLTLLQSFPDGAIYYCTNPTPVAK